jgi:hypothetical protein
VWWWPGVVVMVMMLMMILPAIKTVDGTAELQQ